MKPLRILAACSGASFLIYGVLCFYSTSMANDFHRFGLDNLRILTGILEILGGTGLIVGLRWEPAEWMSSAALALLMFIAFVIRRRMRDGVAVSLPSFGLMLVNLYIFIKSPKPSALSHHHETIQKLPAE